MKREVLEKAADRMKVIEQLESSCKSCDEFIEQIEKMQKRSVKSLTDEEFQITLFSLYSTFIIMRSFFKKIQADVGAMAGKGGAE